LIVIPQRRGSIPSVDIEPSVTPAKAVGPGSGFGVKTLDSRFRGNDRSNYAGLYQQPLSRE
jgi:hypothetical protein